MCFEKGWQTCSSETAEKSQNISLTDYRCEQMIKCNCWRMMGAVTVGPQWNDSCVIITWKVAQEGGSVESFCQTSDCALQLSTRAPFGVITSKLNCFTKMTIIMSGGEKVLDTMFSIEPVEYLFPDRIWLILSLLAQKLAKSWLFAFIFTSWKCSHHTDFLKVIWRQQMCNFVKIQVFLLQKTKQKQNPKYPQTIKTPAARASTDSPLKLPRMAVTFLNCRSWVVIVASSWQQQKNWLPLTACRKSR